MSDLNLTTRNTYKNHIVLLTFSWIKITSTEPETSKISHFFPDLGEKCYVLGQILRPDLDSAAQNP